MSLKLVFEEKIALINKELDEAFDKKKKGEKFDFDDLDRKCQSIFGYGPPDQKILEALQKMDKTYGHAEKECEVLKWVNDNLDKDLKYILLESFKIMKRYNEILDRTDHFEYKEQKRWVELLEK